MVKMVPKKGEKEKNDKKGDNGKNGGKGYVDHDEHDKYNESCDPKREVKSEEEEEYGEINCYPKNEVKNYVEEEYGELTDTKEKHEVKDLVVHTKSTEINGCDLNDTPKRNIQQTQVKLEDKIEKNMTVNIAQPTTGNMKTCLEIVEDEIGLTPSSVTTFYSPLIEVEEVTRRDNNIGLRSPTLTVNIEGWENDGWINLVQSYDDPEENKQRCLYCGDCPRNL